MISAEHPNNALLRDSVIAAVKFSATQSLSKRGDVKPGRERPRESARPEQPRVPASDQITKGKPPDQPSVHLRGVRLNREVDVVSLVVLADRDARAADLQPTLSSV